MDSTHEQNVVQDRLPTATSPMPIAAIGDSLGSLLHMQSRLKGIMEALADFEATFQAALAKELAQAPPQPHAGKPARKVAPRIPAQAPSPTNPRTVMRRFEQVLITQGYSAKTQRIYKNAFRTFLQGIAPRLPLEITKQEVEEWMNRHITERNSSPSVFNTLVNAVKFYYVTVEGRPSGGWVFQRPRPHSPEPQALTKEQVQTLLAHTTNAKHRCLLLLAYSSGLRLAELLQLRRADLDFERMTIAVRQGRRQGSMRHVPLSPKLADALAHYFAEFRPVHWLFEGTRAGEPYGERSAQAAMKQAARRAGLPQHLSLQFLRNSFATHQLEAGIDIHVVQDLLGHHSIRSTGRYAHVARHRLPASPADQLEI